MGIGLSCDNANGKEVREAPGDERFVYNDVILLLLGMVRFYFCLVASDY